MKDCGGDQVSDEYAENDEDDQLSVDHKERVTDNARSLAWMGSKNSGEKMKPTPRGARRNKKTPFSGPCGLALALQGACYNDAWGHYVSSGFQPILRMF